MFQVNVLGTCICTRESIQLMQEKKIDGVIIQMCRYVINPQLCKKLNKKKVLIIEQIYAFVP